MKKFCLFFVLINSLIFAQHVDVREEIHFPDLDGYITLKCDFHIHTVFSDGEVWPIHRVNEAWREGYDVISITDHIEYQPKDKDVIPDLNRPYEIAIKRAQELGILLIKGAEITRDMPPGHFNVLFIKDPEKLRNIDSSKVLIEAKNQGAFVFWNHPGWRQKDLIPIWYNAHNEFYNQGF